MDQQQLKTFTAIVYGLQAASYLIGVSALVGVILNYVKRDDVRGTWLASHFRWQIRTFWFGLLWLTIGALLWVVLVGIAIVGAAAIWLLYRIIKGWLNLYENKPMYPELQPAASGAPLPPDSSQR